MLAIKTDKLTKKYKDKTVVKALDLEVKKGEMYALLGVNGAGKSTTIKMLSCLIKPTSGDAEMLMITPIAPLIDVSRRGLEIAVFAAISAFS